MTASHYSTQLLIITKKAEIIKATQKQLAF